MHACCDRSVRVEMDEFDDIDTRNVVSFVVVVGSEISFSLKILCIFRV